MSLTLGINTPTNGRSWATETAAAGSRLVRQVATGRQDLASVLQAYHASGQQVLLVLANESRQTCPEPGRFVEWYAERYAGLVAAVQVWNEPDGQDGGSSATASAAFVDTLVERAYAFVALNRSCKIVGPGLVSGQPQWLDSLHTWADLDAIAVHPYWKPAGELRGFLDGYRQHGHNLPIWLTEFDLRLDFVRAAAAIPYVEVAIPYCWQAWPGWDKALVDEQGRPLPLLDVFKQAAKEIAVPEFKLGFKDYADKHPQIGKPLSDERYFSEEHDVSIQIAEGGVLYYAKESNAVVCTPTGDPGKA